MKKALKVILYIVVLVFAVNTVSSLFIDGSYVLPYNCTEKVRGFYAEEDNTYDVVFIGASTTYMAVNPNLLWREFGIPGYDFCSSGLYGQTGQLLVKEAIRQQNPKVIAFDVGTLRHADEYAPEAQNYRSLGFMPFSIAKLQTIFKYTPQEEWLCHILPIVKYHSNLSVDFRNISPIGVDRYLGYTPYFGYLGEEIDLLKHADATETLPLAQKAEEALYEIINTCKEQNVDLLLYVTPMNTTLNVRQRYNEVARIAEEEGVMFLDMTQKDWLLENEFKTETDCGNAHMHLNWSGSAKATRSIGAYLVEHAGLDDRRGEEKYADWTERTDLYYRELNSYLSATAIEQADDLETYLEHVANMQTEGICTVIMSNDEASRMLSQEADSLLLQLGAKESLLNQVRMGYLLVNIDGRTVYADMSADEVLYFDSSEHGFEKVNLQASSAGYNAVQAGNDKPIDPNKVIINKTEYSTSRGLNIFVYDYSSKTLISQANFDTYETLERTK